MTIALLVIDFQMEMARRIATGRDHVNGDAGARIAGLLALFRARDLAVLHVRHHNPDPASRFHPSRDTAEIQPCAAPLPSESVFTKSGSSAFTGRTADGLAPEPCLRRAGITRLAVCGAVANFCVLSSVRSAYDLGFPVILIPDATLCFGLSRKDAPAIAAADVMAVTLASLEGEFATLVPSDQLSGHL